MHRKLNMCPLDRILRIAIGSGLVYLGFFDLTVISNEVLRIVLGIIGVVNIISAVYGVCPVYSLAKISTHKQPVDESSFSENPDAK